MRLLIILTILLLTIGTAAAFDLGPGQTTTKGTGHVLMNPGQPDGREGGETMADAIHIAVLPFSDTGNTADNVDDYDAICPYGGSNSPDVVYFITPYNDMAISVDLCGSSYDTKTYIMDADQNVVACNDDYYFDSNCGMYVSNIDMALLYGDTTYYIVIDGYGGDAGDYQLLVTTGEYPHPCVDCGFHEMEGEPELEDGSIDLYNSGCNDTSGLQPFQHLAGTGDEHLLFCGHAGWVGEGTRDTDWFTVTLGSTGVLEWGMDADQEVMGFLLGPQVCETVAVQESMEVGPCVPASLTLTGEPGEVLWLWVGSAEFIPPPGFVGNEFLYACEFHGLADAVVATEGISFDRLKSLYR